MPIESAETILTACDRVPQRVVSLVPSWTQSLVDLGIAQHLIGITDYCPLSRALPGKLSRLGGTKSVNLESVSRLDPDLVIANREENRREDIEALSENGMLIWLCFPRTVQESLDELWVAVRLFRREAVEKARLESLSQAVEWARLASMGGSLKQVFCPIWQGDHATHGRWWMTFNQETYANDLLQCCGAENVFASRSRRYPLEADIGIVQPEEPGERDQRYPRVSPPEVLEARPEVILLPSEPHAFTKKDERRLRELLTETPAVQAGAVHRVDGRLITWHGTMLGKALARLPAYLGPSQEVG